MTLAIPALPTPYRGDDFRSRLEARWAVFFYILGVEYHYEHDNIAATYRLSSCPNHPDMVGCQSNSPCLIPYVPDFWLPQYNLWCEVKGRLDDNELLRLLEIGTCMSIRGSSKCESPEGELIVLGPIPAQGCKWAPGRLHFHKGTLFSTPVSHYEYDAHSFTIANDYGGQLSDVLNLSALATSNLLLKGFWDSKMKPVVSYALDAARAAKFEHGQFGPPSRFRPLQRPPWAPDWSHWL